MHVLSVDMADEITPELFEKLVDLAALELEHEEAEYLRRELNNQLKSIHELAAIPLETETEITSHGVPFSFEITPAIREDIWVLCEEADDILAQAPEVNDRYIVVPEIPHEELD